MEIAYAVVPCSLGRLLVAATPRGVCHISLGADAATRAVARACATNPAVLVIPCHRVVREDGDLGGYRWGLARKGALLEREREATR